MTADIGWAHSMHGSETKYIQVIVKKNIRVNNYSEDLETHRRVRTGNELSGPIPFGKFLDQLRKSWFVSLFFVCLSVCLLTVPVQHAQFSKGYSLLCY